MLMQMLAAGLEAGRLETGKLPDRILLPAHAWATLMHETNFDTAPSLLGVPIVKTFLLHWASYPIFDWGNITLDSPCLDGVPVIEIHRSPM